MKGYIHWLVEFVGIFLKKNKKTGILFFVAGMVLCFGLGLLFLSVKCDKSPSQELKSSNKTYTAIQQQYIEHTQQSLQQLLEPIVGYGKVKVSVSAFFDLQDKQTIEHEVVPDSAVIESKTVTMRESAADSHEQPYQTEVKYTFSTKDIINSQLLGSLEKQHISVVIDGNTRTGDKGIYQARSEQEMIQYTNLIKNAIGYNAARGDTLEVLNMPFSEKVQRQIPWADIAKFLIVLSLALLIVAICVLMCKSEKTSNSNYLYSSALSCLQIIQNAVEKNIHAPLAVIKNWIYMPEAKNNDWTGTQKVSILLLALSDKAVRQILSHLSDDEVRQITKTMASLGVITTKQAESVFEQFNQAMQGRTDLIGNQARVHQILSDTQSKNLPPHTNPDLWKQLASMDNQFLADSLQGLSAEMIAFILYHQEATKAAQILAYFSTASATRVLTHLAHIGHISLTTHYKLDKQAEAAVKMIIEQAQIQAGDKKASEILTRLNKTLETEVVSALYQNAPDLAKKITRHLMKFADIARWSDESVRVLLRHVSKQTAVQALINAPTEVSQAIARNVPPQVWSDLQRQIQSQQNTPQETVLSAQEKIIATAQELLSQKQLHF